MSGIEGRTALVTGGGSGIGLAAASLLARDGAAVTICGRTEAKLTSAVAEIGHGARCIAADVTDEDQIAAAIAFAAEPTGRLDIVFANAGGSLHMGPIADADIEAFRATVDVNLTGTFLTIKHAAQQMRAQSPSGGAIVGMSSGAGHFPHRYLPAYGASKAGIEMLCRYAAEEWGGDGVRVNVVQPGIIADELMAPITAGGKLLDDYHANMPLERVGNVDDVAAAVRFLVGPESSWITGVCVPVDGGHHLRRGANYALLFG
ncbi:MAG TPA: SDR family oxidoreductase [Acidimicrobiia bacterium]|jgi:NAD(P)-dependent dehydrogenase (short-subunit alcohol dehydrogenase family)